MKRYAWVVLVLGLMACGGPPAFAGQLNLIWDQDFTNDTPCQTATQNSCLFEFIAYHTDASNNRVTDFTLPAHQPPPAVVTGYSDRLLHYEESVWIQLLLRDLGSEECKRGTD
jgi:hypothetical protein